MTNKDDSSQNIYLLIGNKNYSTWSLRAWLCCRKAGVIFTEIKKALYVDGYQEKLLEYGPTGLVPVLIQKDLRIWDSLAICETIAERNPKMWPLDASQRAHARAICAEMHSGFRAIRSQIPMNCRANKRKLMFSPELQAEIRRVEEIWTSCLRQQHSKSSPWLFGEFTIADAMYVPLVLHFKTYGVVMNQICSTYMQMVLNDADVKTWLAAALLEEEIIAECEVGVVCDTLA
ncbi:glutathione S-transferase family protein [Undibacterium parvum]|uniref:Glutathione S-transferase family protein n=1 Tax=Undibacterium parvum TaxID=401471 RepID=A0A3Q9BPL3_9BURK|nr:glutathione S-transferase family protein [Undibacterium parvum]AZP11641.1 glutathione S-transferase family protein [Undibacterium parvum]